MFKKSIFIFFLFSLLLAFPCKIFAIVNPLAQPNNKFGIHILFPTEVKDAAALVNSNGGDWGYVVIPIQAGDRNIGKWQQFMNDCKQYHIIPLVRLATEGDYFNTTSWRQPNTADILDFANFLNSLNWPVKNRYIIVFNEVNRADEFGGIVDPAAYANLLSYAATVFKSKNQNFFIISAGMDNAAANTVFSMNEYTYLQAMNQAVPGIFNQIDGMGSHSYPNPGFAQPPSTLNSESISSFHYEKTLLENMNSKQLPVFITETGWPTNVVSDTTAATYYTQAFTNVWSDPVIVAVAPFLLQAGGGPFAPFSLLSTNSSQTPSYTAIVNITKIKGIPVLPAKVLGDEIIKITKLPIENFANTMNNVPQTKISNPAKEFLKWLLGL